MPWVDVISLAALAIFTPLAVLAAATITLALAAPGSRLARRLRFDNITGDVLFVLLLASGATLAAATAWRLAAGG